MATMSFFLWMVPVLFTIHEFEELIMIEVWADRYKEKIARVWPKRKPFGLDYVVPYLTPTIGVGIFIQFIPLLLICFVCAILDNYLLWFGFTIGFLFNGVFLHLREFLRFKGYMPGIITTGILFIPTIWILIAANAIVHYSALEIILSTIIVNGIIGFLAFKYLHKLSVTWSGLLNSYAQPETEETPQLAGQAD